MINKWSYKNNMPIRMNLSDTKAMARRRIGIFTWMGVILRRYLLIRKKLPNLDIIDYLIRRLFIWNNLILFKYSKLIILLKLTSLYRWNNLLKKKCKKNSQNTIDKNFQNWVQIIPRLDLVNHYQKNRKRNSRETITIQSIS